MWFTIWKLTTARPFANPIDIQNHASACASVRRHVHMLNSYIPVWQAQINKTQALLKSAFSLMYRQLRHTEAETTNGAPNGPACDVLMLLCHVWFPSKIMKLLPLVSPLKVLLILEMHSWEAQSKGKVSFKLIKKKLLGESQLIWRPAWMVTSALPRFDLSRL